MPALSVQNLGQRNPAVKDGVEVFAVHQHHRCPDPRVRLDSGVREAADRDEEAEGRLQLALDLAVEIAEVGRRNRVLLPLRFEQVVGVLEAERTVDLLTLKSE